MPFVIPQIVGLLAVALFLLSYQLKRRGQIILCNVASRCLYILQYLLLGAIAGAVLDILGAVASVVAGRKDAPFFKKHIRAVFVATNGVIVAVGLALCIVSRNPVNLLPVVGILFHTGAFWITDERMIRRVSLAGSPFWFAYNFISRAYGSAIGDLLTVGSILLAMLKFRALEKREKK